MTGNLYGIERADVPAQNQLLDWWKRQASLPTVRPGQDVGLSVPLMVLALPDGWTPGRVLPMTIDAQRPYVYDVNVIGYPNLLEVGESAAAWFAVSIEGHTSGPIAFDATAEEFKAALPALLRDVCRVSGGRVIDKRPGGDPVAYNCGRWFLSLPIPVQGLTATDLENDAAAIVVSQMFVAPVLAAQDAWGLVSRRSAPEISVGALGLGWQTRGTGLTLGPIEPRIAEPYVRALPNTTTTAEP
jgi:hypothetical protein